MLTVSSSTTACDPLTAAVTAAVRGASTVAESTRIQRAVLVALDEVGEGWLDSHHLASAIHEMRLALAHRDGLVWDQTRDYVQHVLRESSHVCRSADGARYRIHRAAVCSPACAQPRAIVASRPIATWVCGRCFIRVPTGRSCDSCT